MDKFQKIIKQKQEQAVTEFAEKLEETIADNTDKFINHMENVDPFGVSTEQIDELYNKLYGVDE